MRIVSSRNLHAFSEDSFESPTDVNFPAEDYVERTIEWTPPSQSYDSFTADTAQFQLANVGLDGETMFPDETPPSSSTTISTTATEDDVGKTTRFPNDNAKPRPEIFAGEDIYNETKFESFVRYCTRASWWTKAIVVGGITYLIKAKGTTHTHNHIHNHYGLVRLAPLLLFAGD